MRPNGSYLRSTFLRLKSRRGATKWIIAIAADVLQAAYFILRGGVGYKGLGPDSFERERKRKNRSVPRHVNRLQDLEFEVVITPLP